MQLTIFKIITLCLVLWSVLLVFLFYTHKTHLAATRPPPNETLTTFLKDHPNPIAIYKFTFKEKVFIFVNGPYVQNDMDAPSGPPAYIFDDMGNLMDWTDDTNEGRPLAPAWGSDHSAGGVPTNAVSITIEEAKQLTKPH